jgi:hypothetical protein
MEVEWSRDLHILAHFIAPGASEISTSPGMMNMTEVEQLKPAFRPASLGLKRYGYSARPYLDGDLTLSQTVTYRGHTFRRNERIRVSQGIH